MRIDRLNHLITILATLPPEKLQMDTWRTECGTAACAAGWACLDPHFQQEGLSTNPNGSPRLQDEPEDDEHGDPFYSLQRFFDISNDQCWYLFASSKYPGHKATPAKVIERIREVIEGTLP